jgi:transcriptional regulator with XRE-family HTH domain
VSLEVLRGSFASHHRRCAVYLLVSDGEIIYVGQSQDVDSRLAQHRRDEGKTFNEVLILEVGAEDLLAYEGALIRAVRPRLNRTTPANADRDDEVLAKLGLPIPPKRKPALPIAAPVSSLGFLLQELRANRGKTQMAVAAELGVTSAAVAQWEGGMTLPRDLAGVARAYECDLGVIAAEYAAEQSRRNSGGGSKFSEAIRKARREMRLSMRAFAAHLGVSAANVCEWETGKHATPTNRLSAIAAALGLDPSELV